MRRKSILNKLQFRQQLVIAFVVGIIALATATTLAVSSISTRTVKSQIVADGLRLADSFSRQSVLALLYQSGENAMEAANTTLSFPDVTGVAVYDEAGNTILALGDLPGEAVEIISRESPGVARESSESWLITAPVFAEGEPGNSIWEPEASAEASRDTYLGSVAILVSKSSLKVIEQKILRGNLVVSSGVSLVLLLLLLLLARRVTTPLSRLATVMRRAEEGESNLRASISGPQDIENMQHAFNTMMAVLERRELELRHARDQAIESAKVKGEFAANVSHELRTPMNAVLGMLDLLTTMGLSAKQAEYVSTAKVAGQQLLSLIDDILSFAQVDSGRVVIERSEFSLRDLLEDVQGLMSNQALRKGVEIGYQIADETPLDIYADASRIRQVLINLVGNAVKFTDKGEVSLRVEKLEGIGQNQLLRFEIGDTGAGISTEAQDKIFEAFTQEDSTTTKRYGGTGLGLAICRQLVTLMGGDIRVSSQPGQGSTFWFTVPIPAGRARVAEPRAGYYKRRALFVDDREIVRDFAYSCLERGGVDTTLTEDGLDALEIIRRASEEGSRFDFLVLDEDMSGIRVDDFVKLIARQEAVRDARIVVTINPWIEGELERDHYEIIEKPLTERRLHALMASTAEEQQKAVKNAGTAGAPVFPKYNRRVLVVDDNAANRLVAEGMLEHFGCEVKTATNGREAVEKLVRESVDLVLMDCNMPVMDGYDATKQIRQFENPGSKVPIVAMTANNTNTDTQRCLDSGMDDVIAKPLSLETLQGKLSSWLTLDEEQGQPAITLVGTQSGPGAHLDLQVLERLKESVGEVFDSMIAAFLEDTPVYIQTLKGAIASSEARQVYELSHTIKGSASNFGALEVVDLSRQLEELGRHGHLDGAQQLFEQLSASYSQLGKELENYVSSEMGEKIAEETLCRVLIVDDDKAMRIAFRKSLEEQAYQIEEAVNGKYALSICERRMPDLILMDALMPEIDGFTACEQIRLMSRGEDVPILMITALDDESSISRAFASGATDYIPKPVNISVLRQRVSRLLQSSRVERHVRQLAYHDALTGLPNRAYLMQQLRHKITRAKLNNERLAVLFLDLDRFKIINDSLGHDAGDLLLKAAADRIKRCVRDRDLVARLGGDEFTIVIEGLPGEGVEANVCEKICESLRKPFVFLQQKMFITVSAGVSIYPNDGEDVSSLLKHADTAMFKAKEKGDGYCFYQAGMEDEVISRLETEGELRAALETDQIFLHYQPQKQLSTGEITSVEALVRWKHPQRGLIPAYKFVPVAEESGLIGRLGEKVFGLACRQARQWYEAGIPVRIAVNVSGGELQNGELKSKVEKLLDKYGISPQLLEIEITETMLMEHPELSQTELSELRKLGITIAIDDFGSGFSSLNYLKRFSADVLKIDRTFVKDCHYDKNDQAIISGIVTLARSLGLKVVAEGVEFPEQEAFLRKVGCDMVQGYLIAKPMPAAEAENLLNHTLESLPAVDG